jgi:hypothetical protein
MATPRNDLSPPAATVPVSRKRSLHGMRRSVNLDFSVGTMASAQAEAGAPSQASGRGCEQRTEAAMTVLAAMNEEVIEEHAAEPNRGGFAGQTSGTKIRCFDPERSGAIRPWGSSVSGQVQPKATGWGCKQPRADAPPLVPWPTPAQESVADDFGDTPGWAISTGFDAAKGGVSSRSASKARWAEFALPLQRSPPLRPDTDLDAALRLVWKGEQPITQDRCSHGPVARLAPDRRAMAM